MQLYFEIGSSILDVQNRLGWGSQIIDKLSEHIHQNVMNIKGFSVRNLKYMCAFALAYPAFPFVQVPLAQIPWFHHISLLTKVKEVNERVFYIQATIKNGWSRDTIIMQVKSNLYARQGSAIHNFESALPKTQSDLAQRTIKDPYVFDFLNLTESFKEKELENELVSANKPAKGSLY